MAEEKGEGGVEPSSDSVVLEEEIDPNYVPGEEEVVEYAKWLGMDLVKDEDLYWIAREGLMAPLPKNWKPCKTKGTDEIYYFNFLTGESTWDHPCDGYYKRLYEEEKKKKEVSLKESADTKRAKAKQDVQDLLGKDKDDKKKSKKSKKKNTLGAIGGSGGGVEPGLPGRGLTKALPLGSKPLPMLGKSLDMPPLGGLKAGGLGDLKSSGTASSLDTMSKSSLSGPALSNKSSLKKSNTAAKAEMKAGDDFLEDSDSDFDAPIREEQKQERQHPETTSRSASGLEAPQQSLSPQKRGKSKSSRMSSRIQTALLSDSEEFSRGSAEAEEKSDSVLSIRQSQQESPDVKQVSSYSVEQVTDSPLPVAGVKKKLNFGQDAKVDEIDFVKHQYNNDNNDTSRQGGSDELQRERIALQTERESLNLQKTQFKQDEANFKLEKDMLERERNLLDKEKSVFSTDRATLRREKREVEDLRDSLMRDKEAFQREKEREKSRQLTQSSMDSSGDNLGKRSNLQDLVHKQEQELDDMQRELDGLRREKNATAAELSKVEKSLESEKQLRHANLRESTETSASTHKEIEEALTKIALLEVDKKSNEVQIEQLKKNAAILKSEKEVADGEIDRLKRSLSKASVKATGSGGGVGDNVAMKMMQKSLQDAEDSLLAKTNELNALKNTVSKLEMQIIEADEKTEKASVKLKFSSSETSRLEEELTALQSEKRTIKRTLEDTLDELSRVKRETAAVKRREDEQSDEINRLRPLIQKVRELEGSLESEKSTSRRNNTDLESSLVDLKDSRRRVQELQLQVEDLQAFAEAENNKRQDGDRESRSKNDEVISLEAEVAELKSKVMSANAARVDQANLLDEAEASSRSLQRKINEYQIQVKELESKLSCMPESSRSPPASSNTVATDSTALIQEWEGKVSKLESTVRDLEDERDALEGRLKNSKHRVNGLQGQVDSLEADLAAHQSKLRTKDSVEVDLKESIDRLTKELQDVKEKLKASKRQVDVFEDKEQENRKAIRRLSEQNETLEAERNSLVHEKQRMLTNWNSKLQHLEEEKDRLERALTDAKSNYEDKLKSSIAVPTYDPGSSCANSDSSVEELTAEMASVKSDLEQEKSKSLKLQREMESLSQQLQISEKEMQAATALLNSKSTVDSTSSSPTSSEIVSTLALDEIKQLKEELYNERRRNNTLQSDLADAEFRLRRGDQTVEELRMEVSENANSAAAQQLKIRQYQDELLGLQQRLHAAEVTSQNLNSAKIASLSISPEQTKRKELEVIESMRELEDSHQQQLMQLQSSIEELHSENASLHQQLHTMKNNELLTLGKLEEAQFQSKIVQQSLQNFTQRCETQETDLERMKNERHQLMSQVALHSNTIEDLRSQLNMIAADKDAANASVESRSNELFRLREEIRSLQGKLSVAEQRSGDSQREINAMKESSRLQALASTGSNHLDGAQISCSSSIAPSSSMDEMRIRELRLENERLAVELSQAISDVSVAKKTISELQDEVNSLRTRLANSQKELTTLQEQFALKKAEVSRLYDMNSNNNKAIKLLSTEKNISFPSESSSPIGVNGVSSVNSGLKRAVDGHEEKISELQHHRREWEDALSQQNILVQRLEEKLKDTEHVLSYHIQHQQHQQLLQQQQHQLQHHQDLAQKQIHKSFQPSPPLSPNYSLKTTNRESFGSTRPRKEHSRSPRIYQEYLNSLRGFNSHMNHMVDPNHQHQGQTQAQAYHFGGETIDDNKYEKDYGAEIDSRLQDLTFEQDEISDEEDILHRGIRASKVNTLSYSSRGRSKPPSRDGSSAISVLKEVLLDLIRREGRGGRASSARGRQESHHKNKKKTCNDSSVDWKQKVKKEKTLVFNVKKALKLENVYIKQVQDNLSKQRDGWKLKKDEIKQASASSTNSNAIKSQKEFLKEEGDRLNSRATQLNELVHQIRRTQVWVVEREKKIAKMESIIADSMGMTVSSPEVDLSGKDTSPNSDTTTGNAASLEKHLEKMRQLEAEMEQDLTILGEEAATSSDDSMPTPNFNHNDFYSAENDGHIDARGAPYSKNTARGGKERQRLRFDPDVVESKFDRQNARPVLQNLPLHGESHHQGNRHSAGVDDRGVGQHGGGTNYYVNYPQSSQHIPQHHAQGPDFYPQQQQLNPAQFPPYQHHHQAHSHIPAPPPPPPSVVGITANHFAERFDGSAHQLNTYALQTHGSNSENVPNVMSSSMADSVRRGNTLGGTGSKSNLRSLVEHRSKSAEAAESHVSWLDNLRKEISQFPHSTTSTGAMTTNEYMQQPFGEVTSRAGGGKLDGYDRSTMGLSSQIGVNNGGDNLSGLDSYQKKPTVYRV